MLKWQRLVLVLAGVGLVAVWPLRWLANGLPGSFLAVEGGGAWPLHLLAELVTAALFVRAGARADGRGLAAPLAFGMAAYGAINGLSYGVYGNAWQICVVVLKLIAAIALATLLTRAARVSEAGAPRWPGALLAFVGLGMIGFWSLQLASGIMSSGLRTVEGNAYLAFHVAAELLGGATALGGGLCMIARRPGGLRAALTGGGAVAYAAMNSIGWAVLNDAALGMVFIISTLAVAVAALGLRRVASGVTPHR